MPSAKKVKKAVEFKFYAPTAKKVGLAGDFNQWDPSGVSAKKAKDGTWKAKVSLVPGKYQYKFFVDGQWLDDPNCSSYVPNDFGTLNCMVEVR